MDAMVISEHFPEKSFPIDDNELIFPLTLPEMPDQPDTRDPITKARSFNEAFAQTALDANHQEVDGKMTPETS